MSTVVAAVLSALLLHATPAKAYCSYYYGCSGNNLGGGGIAGVVIGIVVFFLLLLTCCLMGMRRRRTYYNSGGQGPWYPVSRGGIFPAAPQSNAEAGLGGQQAGWNTNGPSDNRGGWLNNQYAPSGAPSGSTGHWVSEGPGAVPPPYESKPPQYAPPPGEPPAAHVRS
ncbi:uncharacterized protein C8Q71DRAFT_461788 [Rhodofomes roseus]|uniref:Uncharacterized protein n=1 Tax=Rhodofomes roseus TaxID=34475 RepID=A0ABQ8KMV6_9APHY|nr:uncharacterized protein C8Q71DRAFT_461788 [Rhodofomes roseus]KAH9839749.1 hypothetical protein C8Q71DRAFT_461788 [Rhodofomes roseus]